MTKAVRLDEIANERRQRDAKTIRERLFSACRNAIDEQGDDLAGFALVVWDREGDLRSAYDARHGPIGPYLVPTLVSDALNRHLAVMLAEQRAEEEG